MRLVSTGTTPTGQHNAAWGLESKSALSSSPVCRFLSSRTFRSRSRSLCQLIMIEITKRVVLELEPTSPVSRVHIVDHLTSELTGQMVNRYPLTPIDIH